MSIALPHVLAVDDDPDLRRIVGHTSATTTCASPRWPSGREMDEVMARETIDLVVLDLKLPGEDGMQIARRLRESRRRCRS